MSNFLESLAVGALGSGVNKPTFVVLNATLLLTVLSLVWLLVATWSSRPDLTPHVVFLLILACGLWGSIVWFISNIGFVATEDQKREIGLAPTEEQTEAKNKDE